MNEAFDASLAGSPGRVLVMPGARHALRVALISQIHAGGRAATRGSCRRWATSPSACSASASASRYGSTSARTSLAAPPELDVVMPASRERIAPLLRALEPDLALCVGFPWKLPADALAVPRLGVVNTHPSLLPRYRGPIPSAWAIRERRRARSA